MHSKGVHCKHCALKSYHKMAGVWPYESLAGASNTHGYSILHARERSLIACRILHCARSCLEISVFGASAMHEEVIWVSAGAGRSRGYRPGRGAQDAGEAVHAGAVDQRALL